MTNAYLALATLACEKVVPEVLKEVTFWKTFQVVPLVEYKIQASDGAVPPGVV